MGAGRWADEGVVESGWQAAIADSARSAVQDPSMESTATSEQTAEEPLFAEGDAYVAQARSGAEDDGDIWSISMRLGFGLALVVLLAWGAAHLLRKSTLGKQLGADNTLIRVAERAYLGPKKAVFKGDRRASTRFGRYGRPHHHAGRMDGRRVGSHAEAFCAFTFCQPAKKCVG